jgi:hypothetical protein
MARSSGRVGYDDKQPTRSLCFKSAGIVLGSVNFAFPPERRVDAISGSSGIPAAEPAIERVSAAVFRDFCWILAPITRNSGKLMLRRTKLNLA